MSLHFLFFWCLLKCQFFFFLFYNQFVNENEFTFFSVIIVMLRLYNHFFFFFFFVFSLCVSIKLRNALYNESAGIKFVILYNRKRTRREEEKKRAKKNKWPMFFLLCFAFSCLYSSFRFLPFFSSSSIHLYNKIYFDYNNFYLHCFQSKCVW